MKFSMCPFSLRRLSPCSRAAPDGTVGFRGARIISSPSSSRGKGTFHVKPDVLSHDPDRRPLHLLQRGRPEGCARPSAAAWTALFVTNVRASLFAAFRSLSPCRARLPGLRTQRLAGPEELRVYVRSLRRDHESLHRGARALALHALHAGLRWTRGISHG